MIIQVNPEQRKASPPVSLCRGYVLKDNVIVHPNQYDEKDDSPFIGGSFSSSFMKPKLSFEHSGSLTQATELNSSICSTSFGDQDSLADSSLNSKTTTDLSDISDQDLLVGVEEAAKEDKMVLVAQLLGEIEKRNLSMTGGPQRHAILKQQARLIEEVVEEHQVSPEAGGWKKQCVMHGKHADASVYIRVNEDNDMKVRIEAPMEASLLIPLLSVLNETDLWTTWVPSFHYPIKFGISQLEKLQQVSRSSQIARCQVDMPWPLNNREIIAANVVAEAVDEIGAIVVRARSLEEGQQDGIIVPPVEPGWDRCIMNTGIMITKCPEDHIAPKNKKKRKTRRGKGVKEDEDVEEDEEPLLLFSLIVSIKPAVNFIMRTAIGPMFTALLSVADDVRVGKRPLHQEAMDAKPELYDWLTETIEKLEEQVVQVI